MKPSSLGGGSAVGTVFDVRRHAVHDGPGIRTTIFLKGCPLSCPWCHNPEGLSFSPELVSWPERCLSCGACSAACPNGKVGTDACTLCGACVRACPAGALEMVGIPMTVDEVVQLALADEPYYDESGGGITFSGGEPLAQGDFVLAAVKALSGKGFHSTIDTSGYAPTDLLIKTIQYTNLYLYDIKYMNDEKHRQLTGVGNKLIHANIMTLADCGADVIISVPLIPGFNDDTANLEETARFVEGLKPAMRSSPYPVRVLPYHDAARSKYTRRKLPYRCADTKPPDAEKVARAVAIFRQHGIETRTGGLA